MTLRDRALAEQLERLGAPLGIGLAPDEHVAYTPHHIVHARKSHRCEGLPPARRGSGPTLYVEPGLHTPEIREGEVYLRSTVGSVVGSKHCVACAIAAGVVVRWGPDVEAELLRRGIRAYSWIAGGAA